MSYAPLPLILRAAENLRHSAHPLVAVTLAAMLSAAAEGAPDSSGAEKRLVAGIPWGGAHERQFLDKWFRLPGPPDPEAPYRAIWHSPGKKVEPWVQSRYADTSVQRMRTGVSGRGKVFQQKKADKSAGRNRDEWSVVPTAGADLVELAGSAPVKIVDLALWFGRQQNVSDIDGLVAWFESAFKPNVLDLVGTIFIEGIPDDYRDIAFESQPVPDPELAESLGATQQAQPLPGAFETIIDGLESQIRKTGFELLPGMVRRVLSAWLRGDIVVLVGQPGTGKTAFASALGTAMKDFLSLPAPLVIPVRSDFDESEFIGYERLDGEQQLRDFAREVLETERPLDACVVILEEFNLATIEDYLASVLVAVQEPQRRIRLPGGEHRSLPVDAFILATCNSYIDEPETRTRISAPAKRRATIITMPNILAERVDESGSEAIVSLAVDQILMERARIQKRADVGLSSMFDPIRASALSSVNEPDHFSVQVREALTAVSTSIIDTPEGRSWFTMGILRDLSLAIALADRNADAELSALVAAVSDKIVPQLRGPHERADRILNALVGLPGVDQVERLLDRMKDGPADELLPLL